MEAPQLDVLASQARTALTDPGALGLRETRDGVCEADVYAVAQLDAIINTLNPAEWTRETAAVALRTLGRHLAEVADAALALSGPDVVTPADTTYAELNAEASAWFDVYDALSGALDRVDSAISSLEGEEE